MVAGTHAYHAIARVVSALYKSRRMLPSDPVFWLAAALAVTCFGFAKGGFGGVGMAATPILALVVPPLEAAAILLPILLMQDAISLWAFRKEWDGWNLKVLLPGAVAGIALAWALATVVSGDWVKLIVGAIAFVFVMNQWFGLAKKAAASMRPSAISGIFWGAASGFTSTLAHAGSPPMSIHVLPQQLPKMVFLGTFTIFFAVVNAIKVVPFALLGEFTPRALAISLALMPLAIVSNVAGIWLARRVPEELFYRVAYFLMFLVSLWLIWQGASAVIGH